MSLAEPWLCLPFTFLMYWWLVHSLEFHSIIIEFIASLLLSMLPLTSQHQGWILSKYVLPYPESSQTLSCIVPPSPCTVLWLWTQPNCSSYTKLLTVYGFCTFTCWANLLNCPCEFLDICSGQLLRPLLKCPNCCMKESGSNLQFPNYCSYSVLYRRFPWWVTGLWYH